MSGQYDDILHLPRPVSDRHARMNAADRAAQFSPFAALTGFEEAIDETGRLTQPRIYPDEWVLGEINRRLARLEERIREQPPVTLIYFQEDVRKSGGAYVAYRGRLKRIDPYRQMLIFVDGTQVYLEDILELAEE